MPRFLTIELCLKHRWMKERKEPLVTGYKTAIKVVAIVKIRTKATSIV